MRFLRKLTDVFRDYGGSIDKNHPALRIAHPLGFATVFAGAILKGFAVAPGMMISILLVFIHPSIEACALCAFSIAATSVGDALSRSTQAHVEIMGLQRFIRCRVLGHFTISEVPLNDLLAAALTKTMSNLRALGNLNTSPLARVFILGQLDWQRPLGAWKGFVPTRAFLVGVNGLANVMSPGYVFCDLDKRNVQSFDRFRLAHETAHCTNLCMRIKQLPGDCVVAVAVLWCVVLSFHHSLLLTFLCGFYSAYRWREIGREYRTRFDELTADALAFQSLWKQDDIDQTLEIHDDFLRSERPAGFEARLQLCTYLKELRHEGKEYAGPALDFERDRGMVIKMLLLGVLMAASSIPSQLNSNYWGVILLWGVLGTLVTYTDTINSYMRYLLEGAINWMLSVPWGEYRGLPAHMRVGAALQDTPAPDGIPVQCTPILDQGKYVLTSLFVRWFLGLGMGRSPARERASPIIQVLWGTLAFPITLVRALLSWLVCGLARNTARDGILVALAALGIGHLGRLMIRWFS